MLPDNDLTLRRDELGHVLKLSPKVIQVLISSGALKTVRREGTEMVTAKEIERFLRDSLLHLYYAQATRAAAARPAVEVEEEFELDVEAPQVASPVSQVASNLEPEAVPLATAREELALITRTTDEHEVVDKRERPNLRLAARYIPRRQISGLFREVKFAVVQLSNEGLRIRHSDPIRPGEEARLSIALQTPSKSFVMKAQVVWTSIAQRGDEPSFYVSGLRVTVNPDRLAAALDLLRNARELQLDQTEDRHRPKSAPKPMPALPDDDVVAIIRAVKKFASDPQEATRWYTRARFSIAEDEVRRAAPRGAREREEVVGIWEYLHRRVDLRAVAGVIQWIRSSQAAAL